MTKSKNKIFTLFLTGLLCFSLAGCGSIPQSNPIKETSAQPVEQKTNVESVTQNSEADGDLHIYILDVGQGSSCLIQNKDKFMLIDAGENSCEDLIVDYLNQFGVTHLDYLIGTHPDSDHIGGLDSVIDNFDVDTVFLSAITDKDTTTCTDVLDSLDKKSLSYSTPAVGESYTLGDASFLVLAPSNHYEDANNNSIAIKFTYGEFDFLTTGDCEKNAERDICNLPYDLNVEVYNAGHHGSSNASSAQLLDKVKPIAVTISCGADNKYNHPHDKTMKRFAERNITTYRTDELGTIEIISDGKTFNINGVMTENKIDEVPSVDIVEEEPIVEETEMSEFIEENNEEIVYITKTGSKYHRESCDSLSNSKIEVSLEDALAKDLEPCKKCNP